MKIENGLVDANSIAVASVDKPKLVGLRQALECAIGDFGHWYERQHLAEEMTWCVWAGQTDDGLKWRQSDGDEEPFPWEGAQDTRVRLVDEKLRESCRICDAAFKRGRWMMTGAEGTDHKWAGRMTTLMKWAIDNQMRPMANRERHLALFWRNQLGVSILGMEWDRRTNTRLQEVNIQTVFAAMGMGPGLAQLEEAGMDVAGFIELVAGMLERGEPVDEGTRLFWEELQNAIDLVSNPEREDELVGYAEQLFPEVKKKQLRKAVVELRETGKTRLPQPYLVHDRPRWRALKVGDDVFFPANTESMEEAEWVARREWLSEAEVLEAVKTRGWSEEFRDAVLGTKGLSSTHEARGTALGNSRRNSSGARSWETGVEDIEELYEIFCFYYEAADEWGNLGLYKTEMSLHLGEDEDTPYGSHGLLEYEHGKMPFREQTYYRDGRHLLDCVGVPYLIYTNQLDLKQQRDFRCDYMSISILPPMRRHPLDQNTEITLGPAGFVYEHVRGSTEWMSPPRADLPGLVALEDSTRLDAERITGSWNPRIPDTTVVLHQQALADAYLDECVCVLKMTFQLLQQYLDEVTVMRAAGPGERPFKVTHDEIQGAFDFRMVFDARELSTEFATAKGKAVIELLALDVNRVIDRNQVMKDLLGLIDHSWAEAWVEPAETAAREEIEDEELVLTKMFAGIESAMMEEGQNFQVRQQYLMQQLQQNPRVQQAMQGDEVFATLMQNRLQHLDFAWKQKTEHAEAGRVGTKPVYAG